MKIKIVATALILCVGLVLGAGAMAQDNFLSSELENVGNAAFGGTGTPATDLPTAIGNVINVILGFLGVVLLVIVIYGGFLYMTSGGSEDKAKKGVKWIINGIIGLVIILLAYAITDFVVGNLVNSTK